MAPGTTQYVLATEWLRQQPRSPLVGLSFLRYAPRPISHRDYAQGVDGVRQEVPRQVEGRNHQEW